MTGMDFDKFKNYDTEDFVQDENFCRWVKKSDQESDGFWKTFLKNHPDKKKNIHDATVILKALQPVEEEISDKTLGELFLRIHPPVISKRPNTLFWLKMSALFFLLFSLGGVIYLSLNSRQKIPFEFTGEKTFEKGQLILQDGTVFEFDEEQSEIVQSANGGLTLNNDTVFGNSRSAKYSKVSMNQVIIPYGKRSHIILADGTKIWLNSGSQLSYPSDFGSGSREVYLTGEAFFEVAPDLPHPFFVITHELKIKVLGTRFNVASYANDLTMQTVLVEGKVSASKNKIISRPVELAPGERLVFDKEKENLVKEPVDISLYTSWVKGYLIFEKEPLSEIFKKLERFYNKRIEISDGVEQITFSGKLDLTENIERVFENISYSASINVDFEDEVYTIKL